MKILAVTDIHGAFHRVNSMIALENPDMMVIGGDLTTAGTTKEAEDAVRGFMKMVPRIVCVAGNMDSPAHDTVLDRLDVSVNGRAVLIGGVAFFGVSGAPISPLHTPYEISEEEILSRARKGFDSLGNAGAAKTIFVPHAPPYGTSLDRIRSGAHVGSTAVRAFIGQYRPDLVLCGHIHEACGEEMIGPTRVVHCGAARNGYYVIVMAGDELSVSLKELHIPGN